MKQNKKFGYYSIIAIFIIISISFILKSIYIAGEDCFNTKLLPDPIWRLLDIYFYYEALPFRCLNAIALLAIISILIFIFYRKNISNVTAILSATTPIIAVIGWTNQYWVANIIDEAKIGFIIVSVLCIVHTIATGVFLIKDTRQLNKK